MNILMYRVYKNSRPVHAASSELLNVATRSFRPENAALLSDILWP